MLKLGLVVTALAAAGGTATYVVKSSRASEPATAAPPPAVAAPAATVSWGSRAVAPSLPPARPETMRLGGVAVQPEAEEEPSFDRATLERLGLDRGPSRGPADAPVTIVVFTDFMCSYCGKVLGTVDELQDEYPGKIRLVMKQYPVHQEAELAAEAALAAEDQGKFWELHDLMIANQEDLSQEALVRYAASADLDMAKFTRALERREFRAAVEQEMAAGREVDVLGTPAFLINGVRFTGAQPIENFRVAIDEALAAR